MDCIQRQAMPELDQKKTLNWAISHALWSHEVEAHQAKALIRALLAANLLTPEHAERIEFWLEEFLEAQ